ncbi:regulator of G-protein signaling 12 isoform X1 [Ictalurus furcatus]|uniref:regulator of G-protein signaling 12 isoform X1 n=1 Tax=Ictalurus furcatus TaxID=66913 RepID=UPI00235012AB|nr:regulator of G-protein signaling 12 isoform X1 [Ictalurus furcatus]XP_053484830.1 regulator of G-protein signaling 12 isoform X1 [Ictalurus furcatus]XP_053484831.1 regulator of G-protein signaling 12 isoform X1 [Ictalurus furcatus]
MRALEPAGGVKRSLDFSPAPKVRSVEIERGRAGYGFTVVGQAPCVLSGILKGSPADDAGLKPGDCVLSVNDTDVSTASHETVVELIGSSLRSLSLLVSSVDRHSVNFASDSLVVQLKQKETWSNPGQVEPYEEGIGESVGSFNTVLEISGQACTNASKKQPKQRPRSEPDMSYWSHWCPSKHNPHALDREEPSRVVSKDSVFSDFQSQHDILPDSSALNVGMVVGYINSIELDLVISHSEKETLRAIRECITQIATEQKTHYLVMMRVKCNCVQLCDDRDVVLAAYPAENLVLCAVCTEDNRFFGLVSKEVTKTGPKKAEQSTCMKTLCHVFIIDPELCDHDEHKSISDHFGFSCTADSDTQGCLEFPHTPYSMLNFVSVLYTDMGDHIEKLRVKLDSEDCDEQQSTRNSGSGDSGIGNVSPEDQESFADQWSLTSPNSSHTTWDKPSPCISQQSNEPSLRSERRCLLAEPFPVPATPQTNASIGEEVSHSVPLNSISQRKQSQLPENKTKRRGSQRWPSVSIRARWQKPRPTSIDSLADSDTGGPKAKNSTLPPAMEQIPPLRYKTPGDLAYDLTLKLFNSGSKNKDGENKGYRFWGLTRGRSVRKTSARTNRLSLARSLDDLETAASVGDRGGMERHGFGSINSLESNSSLPSVTNHHNLSERRVAAWAVSFERLLQDPVGVRYFSEFLKKEFSEENILFWQACEFFSQVPEHDKKQLSQKAREIYNSFLSSKATTPVNIDSQAQLADDVLTAPRPDMFKQPQLQIFNLMKFDSYARFLKSSLYQECMLAEVEGRPLPDPYHVPCSPAPSKHSFISEHSAFSTPKKDSRKPRTGRSNDDLRDDPDRRNGIFSWYRNRSFGKGPKKREITDFNYNSNGRRESQGSLSSGASQEFNTPCSTLRNEQRNSTCERDKIGAGRSCTVALPDGSSCCVCLKQGAAIRQVLLELCQKQSINMAAVDLFLVGGEKPLVLDQDSMTLSSRDLRMEKRTLFRLDLVPINRSVGLKAKPTKPVAEVLRPVVAKYGLRLNDLVARISGETEALDLGLPISNLDGLRVVLERSEPSSSNEKTKTLPSKTQGPSLTSRGQSTLGDHRSSEKPVKGERGDKPPISETPQKKKANKIPLDDAEEFFELLSRAQSSRADDQRGLLRKEDLVLPDFLRLKPEPSAPPSCSTPTSQKYVHNSVQPPSVTSNGHNPEAGDETDPLALPLSPIHHAQGPPGQDGEGLCDLTLVGEGDISSPNSTLLPPVPTCTPPHDANITPPPLPSTHRNPSSGAVDESETPVSHQQEKTPAQKDSQSSKQRTDGDDIPQDESFEGYAAELRQCQSKMRTGTYSSVHPPHALNNVSHGSQNSTTQYKATFV